MHISQYFFQCFIFFSISHNLLLTYLRICVNIHFIKDKLILYHLFLTKGGSSYAIPLTPSTLSLLKDLGPYVSLLVIICLSIFWLILEWKKEDNRHKEAMARIKSQQEIIKFVFKTAKKHPPEDSSKIQFINDYVKQIANKTLDEFDKTMNDDSPPVRETKKRTIFRHNKKE